jgi:hypothetical protein
MAGLRYLTINDIDLGFDFVKKLLSDCKFESGRIGTEFGIAKITCS